MLKIYPELSDQLLTACLERPQRLIDLVTRFAPEYDRRTVQGHVRMLCRRGYLDSRNVYESVETLSVGGHKQSRTGYLTTLRGLSYDCFGGRFKEE